MSIRAAYSLGIAVCILGLGVAAYLVDIPLTWIAIAILGTLVSGYAVVRRRARRATSRPAS